MQISPKALSYRLFKSNFRFEKYLDVLNDKNRFIFCRFRTSNHRLRIEVGRWTNIKRHNRLCQLCQSCEIGDEFHYVLQCPNFVTERTIIIPRILFNRPSALKLSSLFNKKKPQTIRKLWVFFRSELFFEQHESYNFKKNFVAQSAKYFFRNLT